MFGADSALDDAAPAAVTVSPAEDASFPAVNLNDDRVFTVFKPGSSGTTVDIKTDAGPGNTHKVDYLMVVGHDLDDPAQDGNGNVTLEFSRSPDDITYTPIIAGFAVTDRRIILRIFTQVDFRYYRLRLTRGSGFIPSIGQTQWGERVDVPGFVRRNIDPEEERVKGRATRSQSGQIMGVVSTFSSRRWAVDIPLLANAWIRGESLGQFKHFWDTHAALGKPFVACWNPGNPGSFEKDAFFGVVDFGSGIRRPLQTPLDTGRRELQFTVMGVKERLT
jgi:hypothetical protein